MKLLLLLALLPALASACTAGYDLLYDGQCSKSYNPKYNYNDTKNFCASYDAHVPIINSKQEYAALRPIFPADAWIGLLCDGTKFVWEDGTVATYTYLRSSETCNPGNVNLRYGGYRDEEWSSHNGDTSYFYPACIANTRSWICDSYYLLQQGKSDDLCYYFEQKDTIVSQAETNCESQKAYISPIHDQSLNDFVKRTAVGYGMMQGVHIGLKYVDGKYIWSDGSEADYLNFAPGFPDPSFGECLAMGTGLFPGKWMNVNCTMPLPYMCTKAANVYDESIPPAGCSDDGEFYPGDEIFAPTWGAATGPAYCDYALMDIEDKTRKITAEIVLFESNSCCDTLTIYDGLFGTNVLKKFTGYLGITSVVVKGTTNAIRMEWNATSGAHVRGWHVKVGSVAE